MSKGKAPSFQFYAADFVTDTAEMTDEEVGVYIRLLCHQWVNGSINSDPNRLAISISAAVPKVWDEIKIKFEKGEDGRLRNPRLEQTRQETAAYLEKQSKNGSLGAKIRWNKDGKTDSGTNGDGNGDANSDPNSQNIALHSSSSSSSLSSSSTSSSKPAKSKFSPFMDKVKGLYLKFYKEKNDLDYIWTAKDNKALGGIVSKLKKSYKQKNGSVPLEVDLLKTFDFLLQNLPVWFQERNCDVATLNGNYNSIIKQIIQDNGRGTSATDGILADIETRKPKN